MRRPRKKAIQLTRRWRVALANAGLKQATWAKDHGWTEGHVSQVVAGKRESAVVLREVEAFIAAQEAQIGKRAMKPAPDGGPLAA